MREFTSIFRGITTPLNTIYEQIAQQGWEVRKVKWDKSEGSFVATAKNAFGEERQGRGPTDATALGNLLYTVMRHNHIRTTAQWKVGMWRTMWTDRLQELAEAYAKAPVYDPKAVPAWKALADDSVHRMEVLANQLQIEVVDDPEPYATSQEMADDIHRNRHFYVSRANSSHPVWTVDQNVAFRTVHDVLGHAVAGGDFGWQGENLACAAHFPLLSPLAQQALFTECLAQTAYAIFYRGFGPQKVALLPEFLEDAQQNENPAGHQGVHPSLITAPVAMPQLPPSPDEEAAGGRPSGNVPPHMEGLGLTPVMTPYEQTVNQGYMSPYFGKRTANTFDPNYQYNTAVDPLENNAYLWHGDPFESRAVMENARLIDTGWSKFKTGDGEPDRERMKQAIVNAFRVVLLSPRKDLRWNAIHYQDISHIPAGVTDPAVYWNALEKRRQEWNVARFGEEARYAHLPYMKFLKQFENIIFQQNPYEGYEAAKDRAERIIFDWINEEQDRIAYEDKDKPPNKQRSSDEVERRANEAVARRMKLYIKDFQPTLDFTAAQDSLFEMEPEEVAVEEKPDRYGAWMGTHLKAIAQISQHADELLDAALEDVQNHDGTGHHFRAKVLQLGISGVGPKVASFAWLLLQPMTSQLATIDTHMMDVLGRNYEQEMNNRDYFKFERELQAGRDAAGYGHVPLGAFQWGMWDHKRTGPGTHQDHSAMRVLDPVNHQNIDWASKAQNLKGEAWTEVAPPWWQDTLPYRQQVAQDWEQNIATQYARNKIPFSVMQDALTPTSARKASAKTKMQFAMEQIGTDDPREVWKLLSDDVEDPGRSDQDSTEAPAESAQTEQA